MAPTLINHEPSSVETQDEHPTQIRASPTTESNTWSKLIGQGISGSDNSKDEHNGAGASCSHQLDGETEITTVTAVHDSNDFHDAGDVSNTDYVEQDEDLQLAEEDVTGNAAALTPPYWLHHHHHHESYPSIVSPRNPETTKPITLVDHTIGDHDENGGAVWAKAIYIEDYVVVGPSSAWRNGPSSLVAGSFVVWQCKIDTIDGGSFVLRKRYSEFLELRTKLLLTFPLSEGVMPPFPPKSVVYRFKPTFLERRRIGLGYWLTCILLNPEFSSSPITKDFIFGT